MSFSFSATGPATEVKQKLENDVTVPSKVAAFAADQIDQVVVLKGDDTDVAVSVYGHAHQGKLGYDTEEGQAHVSVK